MSRQHVPEQVRPSGGLGAEEHGCRCLERHQPQRSARAREECAQLCIVFHHDVADTVVRGKLQDCAPNGASSCRGGTPWQLHAVYVDDFVVIEHNHSDTPSASASNQDGTIFLTARLTLRKVRVRGHERRRGGLRLRASSERQREVRRGLPF